MAKMTAQNLTITVRPTEHGANTESPQAAREDHMRSADRHHDRHRDEARALWRQFEALRTLFGRGLSAALEEHAENAAEHASEESYHLRQELAELARRSDERLDRERSRSADLAVELARTRVLLREIFDYETTPRRARANRPEWTAKVAEYLTETESRELF